MPLVLFENTDVFLLHVLNKNENIINAGYWQEPIWAPGTGTFWIAKISLQREKLICLNRKNLFPQNTKKWPIRNDKLPQKFLATRYTMVNYYGLVNEFAVAM